MSPDWPPDLFNGKIPNGIPMGIGTPSNSGNAGPDTPILLVTILSLLVLKAKWGSSKLQVVNLAFHAKASVGFTFFIAFAFTKISPC